MTPGFDDVASGGGHKDATFHVGGHGEPWPDIKVMAITWGGQTWVCVRRDGAQTVTTAGSVREGLEMFAAQLQSAIRELPPRLDIGQAGQVSRLRRATGLEADCHPWPGFTRIG